MPTIVPNLVFYIFSRKKIGLFDDIQGTPPIELTGSGDFGWDLIKWDLHITLTILGGCFGKHDRFGFEMI